MIEKGSPEHIAAMDVIEAMHCFWRLKEPKGAVQWIEDDQGRVVVFTRGEYRDQIMRAVGEHIAPTEFFDLREDDHD